MCDIGDMHTHFPIPIFQFSDRQSVVEIFGITRIDGEGCDISKIFSFCNFFRGDTGIYLIGCFLYIDGIIIWKTKFS